jgi:SAM-dependent methyltransferase
MKSDGFQRHDQCWLCGSRDIVDLYEVNGFTLTKCKACSLRFIREIADDEYLRRAYSITPEQKNEVGRRVYLDQGNEKNLKYAYKPIADKIKSRFGSRGNGPLRLLDLGCSTGAFFDFFPGWDVYGVELEETAGNIARSKYGNIFIGDMKDADFKDNFFDCITIQDALDHSNQPMRVVKRCHELLKNDGILVIKVHNIDCLLSKMTGKKFYAIEPPGHLTYFNLKTLKLLLSMNGFEYMDHYYNLQKLRLDTAVMRASATFSFLVPVYKALSKTVFGKIPFYKNFHDIITVTGVKK